MNKFFLKGSVLLLVLAVVSAQKTTKKPNVPDFEDRYVSNPFTQEELEALSGGGLGGSVGIVPPSDTQGGGGSSGGSFNAPLNQPAPTTTTTTEDFSSVFLGNQPQPQQPQVQPQQPQVQPQQPQQQRPVRPGGSRPTWNRPRPSWGGRRDFNSQW